jgi:hypothetical protein
MHTLHLVGLMMHPNYYGNAQNAPNCYNDAPYV